MSHLTLEALARLVDEAADSNEKAHLAICGACRDELDALKEQRAALAAFPAVAPAPEHWPALRDRLMDEGLMRPVGAWSAGRAGLGRAAAALVLFAAGGALGYAARGQAAPPAPMTVAQSPAGEPAGGAATSIELDPTVLSRDVEQAQAMFLAALDRYMSETTARPDDPATRLAALDHIVHTTAEALNEAPADPVINSYHLTAVAQRNATLRQIAVSGDPVF